MDRKEISLTSIALNMIIEALLVTTVVMCVRPDWSELGNYLFFGCCVATFASTAPVHIIESDWGPGRLLLDWLSAERPETPGNCGSAADDLSAFIDRIKQSPDPTRIELARQGQAATEAFRDLQSDAERFRIGRRVMIKAREAMTGLAKQAREFLRLFVENWQNNHELEAQAAEALLSHLQAATAEFERARAEVENAGLSRFVARNTAAVQTLGTAGGFFAGRSWATLAFASIESATIAAALVAFASSESTDNSQRWLIVPLVFGSLLVAQAIAVAKGTNWLSELKEFWD